MDVVERLVAEDPRIKGIWCVPKYSNPDGAVYSDETVAPAGRDDDGGAGLPDLLGQRVRRPPPHRRPRRVADVLALCAENGHPDRAFVFGSTSKITFAGAGVAFFGSSPANVEWWLSHTAKRSIGPDKINQLRHVLFLRDADGLRAHMRSAGRADPAQVRRWSTRS